MVANLHAAGLIGVVLLTLALVLRSPRPPEGVRNVFKNLAISFLVFFVGFGILSVHFCREGAAVYQWLIPCSCAFLILTFVSLPALRRLGTTLAFLAAFALGFQYDLLVHTEWYTGSPENTRRIYAIRSHVALKEARRILLEFAQEGNDAFPAGPLAEIEPLRGDKTTQALFQVRRDIVTPLWHTAFTGLYDTSGTTTEVWYPGGRPREAADKLEIRPQTRTEPQRSSTVYPE